MNRNPVLNAATVLGFDAVAEVLLLAPKDYCATYVLRIAADLQSPHANLPQSTDTAATPARGRKGLALGLDVGFFILQALKFGVSAGSSFWKGLLTSTEASRVGLKSRCFKANVFVFLKQKGRAPLACIRTCRTTGTAVQHSVSGSVSKPGPGAAAKTQPNRFKMGNKGHNPAQLVKQIMLGPEARRCGTAVRLSRQPCSQLAAFVFKGGAL